MNCPKCRNVGFNSTVDVKKPIKNLGKKEYHDSYDTRQYVCLQCGFGWLTKESFYRDIQQTIERGNTNV